MHLPTLTRPLLVTILLLSVTFFYRPVSATTLVLKNGMELTGTLGKIPGLDNNLLAEVVGSNTGGSRLIYLVDDGLRRTFVSTYQVSGPRDDVETLEHIRLDQPIARQGKEIGQVGAIMKASPFDDWGRRVVSLRTEDGTVAVIQGITEVTPRFTRVRGLQSQPSLVWDMRIATSSIPRDTLSRVLKNHLDATDSDDRLSIVRLYLQSARYQDAEDELRSAMADLPDLEHLTQQLREIRQLGAQQRLQELKLRQGAGQHQLVTSLIPKFPTEGIAGETLLEVQELQSAYRSETARIQEVTASVASLINQIDPAQRGELVEFQEELQRDLNLSNVSRMSDFWRLAQQGGMSTEQQLAVAMSSWLTGHTRENLAVSRSLWRSRGLINRYLRSEDAAERRQLINDLKSEEGGSVRDTVALLATMLPPHRPGTEEPRVGPEIPDEELSADGLPQPDRPAPPFQPSKWVPGLARIEVSGAVAGRTLTYYVQLPPEYDPYRRYPAIVTLHAANTSPQQQIDWWAGQFDQQTRMRGGAASRHGYIVIAPAWSRPNQPRYEYTANEHAAVLASLRDAMGRFSIDTDRVFLSGHSSGGDAAWDIALAHPDLWAGAIPISATAAHEGKSDPKYVSLYWENAQYVPLYFVGGSKDTERLHLNSRDFDRYLKRPGYDTLVVEYLGRGHEHFHDEIHRLFTWMGLHVRNFANSEFEVVTMRPWDTFFWWLEMEGLPEGTAVWPHEWPPQRARALTVKGRITDQSNVWVAAGAEQTTVLLSEPLVDFSRGVNVKSGSRFHVRNVQPDLETVLEDARTRHDRQHPFWAKVAVEG